METSADMAGRQTPGQLVLPRCVPPYRPGIYLAVFPDAILTYHWAVTRLPYKDPKREPKEAWRVK